jgi:ribonucleoside-triphosphate reductase (thioredoxin)
LILDIKPEHRFSLADEFIAPFESITPPWGPIGEFTYRRTYSRRKEDGTNEEWWETVRRVVQGSYTYQKWHCRKLGLPWNERKAQNSAQEMFRLMFEMKFLPPGRGLWMAGTEYIERVGGGALNNCAFISTGNINDDFAEPFCFLMDFSMLGVGVGGDTKGAGKIKIRQPKMDGVHVVTDDREGWVNLTRRLLNAYVGKDTLPSEIDFSLVRPAGIPIRGFGGTSAGSAPLMLLSERIQTLLNARIGQAITSADIVDLFDMIGVCVVSGNIRRSAIIMLGESTDSEFAELKNFDKFPTEVDAYRWASNNSIVAEVGMDYTQHAASTARNGEPGYFWIDTARAYGRMKDAPTWADHDIAGTNPCSEQSLCSGELCCLVETFPSRHATYDEYERTLKFAYLYAKSITLLPTHNPKTNAMVMRNRRIGCSQSGIVESFARHGRRKHLEWCDEGYDYLQTMDKMYSDWLCVPRSRKITSVKPSGTVSLLPGVTPGIHYAHSEYYYRTIRVAKISPLVKSMRKAGYRIEDDVVDPSSMVVYFPIKEQFFERSKTQVSMWEQLENAAALQHYWADNQVSVTVTFSKEEAGDIKNALELYEGRLKSVSFLPLDDHGYKQAPYQTIDAAEYERAAKKIRPVDYSNAQHENEDKFCDGDKCTI